MPKLRFRVALGLALALVASAAHATPRGSGVGLGAASEATLLLEIALLLFVGRGLGEVMNRIGQPGVTGQLLAGLILGPSLFGWLLPHLHAVVFPQTPEQKSLLSGLANVGVMMLLLLTGMETDLRLARKVGTPALLVACAGVALPFACGFVLGQFLPDTMLPSGPSRTITSLFLGTALSISSIKIVATVVRDMNFSRRNLGQIIVASAMLEDTIGWIIIAVTLGIAGAGGFAAGALAKTIVGTLLFLVLSYTIGRRCVFWLIRWVNDNFLSEYAVVTAILIVMCLLALITQAIGVNTVLGAFVAGVLVGESPILSRHIEDQLRGLITAFMMPIFFGLSGLSADLTILRDPGILLLTLALIAAASIGKFLGAFAGGVLGRLSGREAVALGSAMNARGSTEVIVASIGLGMGALSKDLYSMIVAMALLTTIAMPPMLRWALRRVPMNEQERARLEKEEIDARGFVSKFERLLIAADDGANGQLATRLAGVVAGRRGIPLTVVRSKPEKADRETLTEIAIDGAKQGHQAVKAAAVDEPAPDKVEVMERSAQARQTIASEAPKGYDILFLGIERMTVKGELSAEVDRLASDFPGPLALVFAGSAQDVSEGDFHTLTPITGTETARRGAELAFAITPPHAGKLRALYVATREDAGKKVGYLRRRAERALIEDVRALAKRYGHGTMTAAVHTDVEPHQAILREAERRGCDLIVLGTNRRVGHHLAFGQTAYNVLRGWKGALVLVVL